MKQNKKGPVETYQEFDRGVTKAWRKFVLLIWALITIYILVSLISSLL